MGMQRTGTRNRDIFAGYQRGEPVEELAVRYGLSVVTVSQIIMVERHKVAVSVEVFYKKIRSKM